MKTYNRKAFLVPDSPRTMAAIHCKVQDDGIMKVTIHDCKGAIQLHNDLNSDEERLEAIYKLTALESEIRSLINHLINL